MYECISVFKIFGIFQEYKLIGHFIIIIIIITLES